MRLIEIMTTVLRGEYNENYIHHFINAPVVSEIKGFILKKSIDRNETIRYGLFNGGLLIS